MNPKDQNSAETSCKDAANADEPARSEASASKLARSETKRLTEQIQLQQGSAALTNLWSVQRGDDPNKTKLLRGNRSVDEPANNAAR